MRIPYKDDFPVVTLKILGRQTREVEAHIDFAASKTVVPPAIAEELELKFAGFESVATGAGVILMPSMKLLSKHSVISTRYSSAVWTCQRRLRSKAC